MPRSGAPEANTSLRLIGAAPMPVEVDDVTLVESGQLAGRVVRDGEPVPGAIVTLLDARNSQPVPNSCFDDPNQQGQVTIGNGYYKFDINFSNPACPGPGNYLVEVTAPDTAYVPGVSAMIPPTSDLSTAPFDIPSCPGSLDDAVPGTPQHCEAQVSEFAPGTAVRARSPETGYHLFLRVDGSSMPGTSQLFNNHIPLDPRLDGAVAVTKTTPMLHVTRGQLVPYVITVSNSFGADLRDVNIIDRFPAGFRYVEGSARFDGVPLEPVVSGRELIWSGLVLATDGRHEIKLLLAVGAGVTEGEFVNIALATNALTGTTMSAEAMAKVRIIPDPTFDCTDVMGKVFNDSNRNGYQDGDEGGIQGVRLVTPRGLAATTDAHGRYHITCATVPNENRGSNFVLKIDDRTLPSGFRPSTRPVQVQRATRGKALRINFGASMFNEYVRDANFNQISRRSFWHNLEEGFTWDDNEFKTNQLIHPFNGAAYFNSARGNGIGFEVFDDTKLGMTEFVQNVNYQRALQGELSRTINTLLEVESSRVHIVMPARSLFIEEEEPATASKWEAVS